MVETVGMRSEVITSLDAEPLFDYLIQNGILDVATADAIRQIESSDEQNTRLVEHLDRHGNEAIGLFINALRLSGQLQLASSLDVTNRILPVYGTGYWQKTRHKGQVLVEISVAAVMTYVPRSVSNKHRWISMEDVRIALSPSRRPLNKSYENMTIFENPCDIALYDSPDDDSRTGCCCRRKKRSKRKLKTDPRRQGSTKSSLDHESTHFSPIGTDKNNGVYYKIPLIDKTSDGDELKKQMIFGYGTSQSSSPRVERLKGSSLQDILDKGAGNISPVKRLVVSNTNTPIKEMPSKKMDSQRDFSHSGGKGKGQMERRTEYVSNEDRDYKLINGEKTPHDICMKALEKDQYVKSDTPVSTVNTRFNHSSSENQQKLHTVSDPCILKVSKNCGNLYYNSPKESSESTPSQKFPKDSSRSAPNHSVLKETSRSIPSTPLKSELVKMDECPEGVCEVKIAESAGEYLNRTDVHLSESQIRNDRLDKDFYYGEVRSCFSDGNVAGYLYNGEIERSNSQNTSADVYDAFTRSPITDGIDDGMSTTNEMDRRGDGCVRLDSLHSDISEKKRVHKKSFASESCVYNRGDKNGCDIARPSSNQEMISLNYGDVMSLPATSVFQSTCDTSSISASKNSSKLSSLEDQLAGVELDDNFHSEAAMSIDGNTTRDEAMFLNGKSISENTSFNESKRDTGQSRETFVLEKNSMNESSMLVTEPIDGILQWISTLDILKDKSRKFNALFEDREGESYLKLIKYFEQTRGNLFLELSTSLDSLNVVVICMTKEQIVLLKQDLLDDSLRADVQSLFVDDALLRELSVTDVLLDVSIHENEFFMVETEFDV